MVGLGNVLGPFIAAGFIQSTSWRYIFFLICPLAVLSGIVILILVPPHNMPKDDFKTKIAKIDFLGVVTSSTAIILLLIPISGIGSYFKASSPMAISMLAIGGISAVLFILVEWKVAKLPMIPR
jgi:MFS family permease